MDRMNIGIPELHRLKIAEGLKHLLADSYTLYLHTHNFHWNVTGPHFRALHLMFEEQYTELAAAVDDIAERIRTLGAAAPGTYREFTKLSSVADIRGNPDAHGMVQYLVAAHEQLVLTCRQVLVSAQRGDDESTVALISDRMRVHEKTAWMLRASLDEPAAQHQLYQMA